MQVEVFALIAGTTREVAKWRLQPNSQNVICAVYEGGVNRTQGEAWAELSLAIVRRALPSSEDSGRTVEVFLYLQGDLLTSIYNYADLKRFVADARRHAWGNKIYVVWDKSPHTDFYNIYNDATPDLLEVWLRSLMEEDVAGLLEMRRTQTPTDDAEIIKLLRKYTTESARRKAVLRAFTDQRGWCVTHRKAKPLKELLNRFVSWRLLPADSNNRMIFFDRKINLHLKKELLDGRPQGSYFVATIPDAYSAALVEACAQASPPLKLVQFSGHFEAIFSLLQLNQAGNNHR